MSKQTQTVHFSLGANFGTLMGSLAQERLIFNLDPTHARTESQQLKCVSGFSMADFLKMVLCLRASTRDVKQSKHFSMYSKIEAWAQK